MYYTARCVGWWRSCIVPIVLHAHNKLDNQVETQANSSDRDRIPDMGKRVVALMPRRKWPSVSSHDLFVPSQISPVAQICIATDAQWRIPRRCLNSTMPLSNSRTAKEYLPMIATLPPKRVQNRVRIDFAAQSRRLCVKLQCWQFVLV